MKQLLALVLILHAFAAFSQKQDNVCTLTGSFPKLRTGTLILTSYTEKDSKADTIQINKGKFYFKTLLDKPTFAVLTMLDREADNLTFYIEPGNISLFAKDDYLRKMVITGSVFNNDDKVLKLLLKDNDERYDAFYQSYSLAEDTKNEGMLDSLDDIELDLMKEKRRDVTQFVITHPNSLRSALAIEQNFGYYAEASEVAPLYNSLSAKVKASPNGIKVKNMLDIYNRLAVGQQAPEIQQKDTAGNSYNLSSLKGKYVLIDFGASWCMPWRKENAKMIKAYQAYKDKGFEIMGISIDTKLNKWQRAIKEDKLPWINVSDLQGWKNSTAEVYYIKTVPSNVLVDKNGTIIAKNLLGKKLYRKLAELMGEEKQDVMTSR